MFRLFLVVTINTHIPDVSWSGRCDVPCIGTSVNNIYKDPSSLWDVKKEENIKAKFLKFFKSRKQKDDKNVSKELFNSENGFVFPNQKTKWVKTNIKRVKSLPAEKTLKRACTKQVMIPSKMTIF